MTERVMLDLETLGTDPGAAIVSIGAVRFDTSGLGETFHRSISIESAIAAGLAVDGETLEWWLDQDPQAQQVLAGGQDLAGALVDFRDFYGDAEEVWAFSPTFDCTILSAAYDAVDLERPWNYRAERDARTLAALPIAADVEHDGTVHDALDDARHQARMVGKTLAQLEADDVDRGEGIETDGGTGPLDEEPKLLYCNRCVGDTLHSWSGECWICDSCGQRKQMATDGGYEAVVVCWGCGYAKTVGSADGAAYEAERHASKCPKGGAVETKQRETHQRDQVRADGGEVIGVSPLTGVIYAVTDGEMDTETGQIIAEEKRPLSRAEIASRLDEVHGPVRRAYREHLGGGGDE